MLALLNKHEVLNCSVLLLFYPREGRLQVNSVTRAHDAIYTDCINRGLRIEISFALRSSHENLPIVA